MKRGIDSVLTDRLVRDRVRWQGRGGGDLLGFIWEKSVAEYKGRISWGRRRRQMSNAPGVAVAGREWLPERCGGQHHLATAIRGVAGSNGAV